MHPAQRYTQALIEECHSGHWDALCIQPDNVWCLVYAHALELCGYRTSIKSRTLMVEMPDRSGVMGIMHALFIDTPEGEVFIDMLGSVDEEESYHTHRAIMAEHQGVPLDLPHARISEWCEVHPDANLPFEENCRHVDQTMTPSQDTRRFIGRARGIVQACMLEADTAVSVVPGRSPRL